MGDKRKCAGHNKDGSPCQRDVANGNTHCPWHGKKAQRAAQVKAISDSNKSLRVQWARVAAAKKYAPTLLGDTPEEFAAFCGAMLLTEPEKYCVEWAEMYLKANKERWGLDQDKEIWVHFDSTMPEPVPEKED